MKTNFIYFLGFVLITFVFACQPKALKTVAKDSSALEVKKADSVAEVDTIKTKTFDTKATSFPDNVKTNRSTFLKTAVSTGMKRYGFPKELAKEMRENNGLWIGKCPICDAVKSGMSQYIVSSSNTTNSLNSTDQKLIEDLQKGDTETQKLALKSLVDNYVSEHYQRLEMTDAEISAMKIELEAGRKQGMGRMGNEKFCASCDGACAKP